jgi:hypothetical protein
MAKLGITIAFWLESMHRLANASHGGRDHPMTAQVDAHASLLLGGGIMKPTREATKASKRKHDDRGGNNEIHLLKLLLWRPAFAYWPLPAGRRMRENLR